MLNLFILLFKISTLIITKINIQVSSLNGHFTKDIKHYELVVPKKVNKDGSFKSYDVNYVFPLSFSHNTTGTNKYNKTVSEESVNYRIHFDGRDHHLVLKPNSKLTKEAILIEKHRQDDTHDMTSETLLDSQTRNQSCHLTGFIRNISNSRAALSACDGLVGFIVRDDDTYFIEPVDDVLLNGRYNDNNFHKDFDNGYVHVIHKHVRSSTELKKKEKCMNENFKRSYHRVSKDIHNITDSFSNDPVDNERVTRGNYYLECMVVADYKFIQHYSFINVEEYILILMNMVSDYFHDASIGNNIDVSVVRIILIETEKEKMDFDINSDVLKTLENFCKWQSEFNPNDLSHPNHFDIALLLTRHNFCMNESHLSSHNCNMRGLSYVGTACSNDKNCAVNEDDGLTTSLLIAHNIGHLLGCKHDMQSIAEINSINRSSVDGDNEDAKKYFESDCFNVIGDHVSIMSPSISLDSKEWSSCSAKQISHFLLSTEGSCLRNKPEDYFYPMEDILYGAVYDADTQCKMQFGQHYFNAPIGGNEFCDKLWCKKLNSDKAISVGFHVADGTACEHNKWCYNGECVLTGTRPGVVNGGWSSWTDWSECSRTCGGGVKRRERMCNDPHPKLKGRFCPGLPHHYTMCNTEECDESEPQFREMQCREYNSKLFHGGFYKWKPVPEPESDNNQCSLFCINEENVIVKMSLRVIDGTRCRPGSKDTCIQGQCYKVGCDWVIDSPTVEDACGICNGNGSFCNIVTMYENRGGESDLKIITLLKRGIRNVNIVKLKPSSSKIVVSSTDNKTFYLKDVREDPSVFANESGKYSMGSNVTGVYTIPEPNREELYIHGPLTKDLNLFVALINAEEIFLKISYVELYDHAVYNPVFQWQFVNWHVCSVRCGGGVEISKSSCVESRDGVVSDHFCSLISERSEPRVRSCNLHPCKTRWKVWKWSDCSGCVFVPGIRKRMVECVEELQDTSKLDEKIVNSSKCCGPQPPDLEVCFSVRPCGSNSTISNIFVTVITEKTCPKEGLSWSSTDNNICSRTTKICSSSYRQKRFHIPLIESHHNTSKKSQKTSTENPLIVEDFINMKDFHLLIAKISNQSNLGLSEVDFQFSGDKIPKYVIMSNITELFGDDALKYLRLIRDEEQKRSK